MKQMKLLLVSITLFLSACMPIQPGMTPPATTMPAEPTTNSLVNTQWQLTSFGGPNAETPVTGDKALTLEFRPGGQVGGSGGCNSFGGKYQVQGNTLSISQIVSTMMACVTQGVMEQEQRYFQALQAAQTFELTTDHLTLHAASGQETLNFVVVSSTPTASETPTITGTVGSTATLMPSEPPERVNFAPGATTAQLTSLLPSGPGVKQYVLAASANQTMTVDVFSDGAPLALTIQSPDGMRTIPEMMPKNGGYQIGHSMILPATGDYLVTLTKGDHTPSTNYTATFTITNPVIVDSTVPTSTSLTSTTANTPTQPTVQFTLDPSVAHSFTQQTMPASPGAQDGPYWSIYPEHTQITLTAYSLTNTFHTPQLLIYPAKAYAAMNETAAQQIAALQAFLQARPTLAVDQKLPFLPLFNAAQVFHAQFNYVNFANGAGVRYLTQYDQAVLPINNHEMFYTFQGLTADNAYYVAAIFPVHHPTLPADESAAPPDLAKDFNQYLATTMEQLNNADVASFTPDLTQLDALIASLTLQPTKTVASDAGNNATLATTTVAAPQQPGPAFNDRSDPTTLLASYIDAINRKQYARAYGYWETPPNNQSLAQFTQGFADTAAVDLLINPPARLEGASGSVYASIPTVLVATHTDHIAYIFSGCYVARRSNQGNAPTNNPWLLYRGNLKAAAADTNLISLLQQGCPDAPPQQGAYNNLSTPVDLLASLVDALNRKEYRRAYSYWETPPNQQTFDQFAKGYADTTSVFLAVHLPTQNDAGAGQQYAGIPAWLVARHKDGAKPNFVGCYVAHRPNPNIPGAPKGREWHLSRATVRNLPNGADPVALLQQACSAQ